MNPADATQTPMNTIVLRSGPGPREAASKLSEAIPSASVWIGDSAYLLAATPHTTQCATAEEGDLVVAFKGFLHGPGDVPVEARHNAALAAKLVAQRLNRSESIDDLWGRFQVYVLNTKTSEFQVVTDNYGTAELFTRSIGEGAIYASNISALATASETPLELDRSIEDFFLTYGFVPSPGTVFTGVSKVGAAQVVSQSAKDAKPSVRKRSVPAAWEPGPAEQSEDEIIEALHDGFFRSLEELLPPDEVIPVFLGGFDSALVATAIARLGRKVHTYTFRYTDDRYNQPLTDKVAEETGGEHHWVDISPDMVATALQRYSAEVNAPTNWPAYVVQTRIVSDAIRADGHSLAFSGDGCDNLFFGYPLTFKRGQVVERLSKLPNPVLAAGKKMLSVAAVQDLLGRPAVVGAGLMTNAQMQDPAKGYLSFRVFDADSLDRLRCGQSPDQTEELLAMAERLAAPFAGNDSVQLSYLAKKCLTPSTMKMTASNDASGISIISPYQHAGMVALAKALPTELLRPTDEAASSVGKYALTTMAERYELLSPEVIHQAKLAAADVPIAEWYGGPMQPTLRELVGQLPFEVDAKMLDNMFKESLGEKAYQKLISGATSEVANLNHDISLLATYGAMASLAGG